MWKLVKGEQPILSNKLSLENEISSVCYMQEYQHFLIGSNKKFFLFNVKTNAFTQFDAHSSEIENVIYFEDYVWTCSKEDILIWKLKIGAEIKLV